MKMGQQKLPYRVTALKGLKCRSSDAFPRIETNICLDTSYHWLSNKFRDGGGVAIVWQLFTMPRWTASTSLKEGKRTCACRCPPPPVVALVMLVVSVLATGPKGCGFEPAKAMDCNGDKKIRSTPSFGWEVKSEVPCRKILRQVKDILKSQGNE
jgi:hypothetical protein